MEALCGIREGLLLLELRAAAPGAPRPKSWTRPPSWPRPALALTHLGLPGRRGGSVGTPGGLTRRGPRLFHHAAPDLASRLLVLLGAAEAEPYRVLVVDDQEVSAILAGGILNRAGMVVRTVFDPMTVLEAMDEFDPDLVLMDLHMPGANGIELTGMIREHETFCTTPIVFISVEEDRDPPDRRPEGWRGRVPDQAGGPRIAAPDGAPACRARPIGEGAAGVGAGARPCPSGLWTRGHLLQHIDRVIVDGR